MGYLKYEDGEYIRVVRKQYLPYITYQAMGGTLDETAFDDFEYEAEMLVNWYTFNRLKEEETYPEELERCMYKLIQLAKLKADSLMLGSQTTTTESGGSVTTTTTSAAIASQSNDGVSISYNTIGASDIFDKLSSDAKGNLVESTIKKYLQGVKNSAGKRLTYRGMYPDE